MTEPSKTLTTKETKGGLRKLLSKKSLRSLLTPAKRVAFSPISHSKETQQPTTAPTLLEENIPPTITVTDSDITQDVEFGIAGPSKDMGKGVEEFPQAQFLHVKLFVCGASIQNHVQTVPSWTYTPIYLFDVFQLALEQTIVSEGFSRDFDISRSVAYFVGLSDSDDVLDQLAKVNNPLHAKHVFQQYDIRATFVNPKNDLRSLFESSGSEDIKLILLPLLRNSRSSKQTASTHAAYPGIDPTPHGSDRDAESSRNPESTRSGHFAMQQGFTKAYEYLAANAVQSLLPNELGIEFKLRNENNPSRRLEDAKIVEFVTSQLPESQFSSQEVDIFGYVDYFNEERIINKEETSTRIQSLKNPTLTNCRKSLKAMADRSGDISFPGVSPGEAAAIGRPLYAIFECGTFSRPKSIHDKFAQVEDHLMYLLERQRRKQNKPEISITDIVAVAGVISVFAWETFRKTLGASGDNLDKGRYSLCHKLAEKGRLLVIHVDDPYTKTVALDTEMRKFDKSVGDISDRLVNVEKELSTIGDINDRLGNVEKELSTIGNRLSGIETAIQRIADRS